ncbi:DMT family transporter [Campylobacter sputorum]|uniref:DMT family transporter n=1 Tax=Campylobacter sputorum TaxID=206 RepID=UPI000B794CAA|nr:SMR family transporter [Campylobacter sputorum]ASM36001.1 multidrug efflux system protein, EmrE family [Campylobacter sputorum bv. faecalis CCUG 20703]
MNKKGLAFVIIGAIFECGWVYGLKFANSNLSYFLTACFVLASTYFFLNSFKFLPTSLAYILYVGLGTLFVVIVEIIATKELEILRLICIAMLMVGIYGLNRAKV